MQTLCRMDTFPAVHSFVILDEAHHIPSETFSQCLFKINSRYLLALTATPNRQDGLIKVLHWHIGDIFYRENPNRGVTTTLVKLFKFSDPTIKFDIKRYADSITDICCNTKRNNYIVDILINVIVNDPGNERKILVLTERKTQAQILADKLKLKTTGDKSIGLYLGHMKKKELEEEITKDILFATFGIFSEGISKVSLNTILFASPKKDVRQSLGRIFRKDHPTETPALVLDVVDNVLQGQSRARLAIYRSELDKNIKVESMNYPDVQHLKVQTENWSIFEIK